MMPPPSRSHGLAEFTFGDLSTDDRGNSSITTSHSGYSSFDVPSNVMCSTTSSSQTRRALPLDELHEDADVFAEHRVGHRHRGCMRDLVMGA